MFRMRLSMTLPSGWQVESDGNTRRGVTLAKPLFNSQGDSQVRVSYGPMLPAEAEADPWISQVLSEGIPQGGKLEIISRDAIFTDTGFPMLLVVSVVKNAEGNPVEARISGFYAMLSAMAVAIAQAPSAELLKPHEEEIKNLLRSATPDWEAGLCTIAALYEGLPTLWETT